MHASMGMIATKGRSTERIGGCRNNRRRDGLREEIIDWKGDLSLADGSHRMFQPRPELESTLSRAKMARGAKTISSPLHATKSVDSIPGESDSITLTITEYIRYTLHAYTDAGSDLVKVSSAVWRTRITVQHVN